MTSKNPFKKGETLLCIGGRDLYELTTDKHYLVHKDEEEGIFPNRPYVTVIDNYGKPLVCHASRFKRIEE